MQIIQRQITYSLDLKKINVLTAKQIGRHLADDFVDDILKCILSKKNVLISIGIPLKFVPQCQINNIPALLQLIIWCRLGDKPLTEPLMFSLLTHMCITRPKWVKMYIIIRKDPAAKYNGIDMNRQCSKIQ